MANLIDKSFFKDQLFLSQLADVNQAANLLRLIKTLEPEFLRLALGWKTYKVFKTWIDAPTIEQRWIDLKEGVEYVDRHGIQTKWLGLVRVIVAPIVYSAGPPVVNAVDGVLQSPIANYIYYYWLRKEVTTTTQSGEKAIKGESPTVVAVGSVDKQVRAWNEMIEWNCEMYEFMYANQANYPEFFENGLGYGVAKHLYKPINDSGL